LTLQLKSKNTSIFINRDIVIATKHKKEQVISPLLKKGLMVNCIVPKDFDTDVFGTFSGEVEREVSPVEAARLKCLKAIEMSGCDLAIASEGSFGTHPSIFFAHADSEIVMLVDKKNNLEIWAYEISTKTNFDGAEMNSFDELLTFAKAAKFPSHGLILRKSKDEVEDIFKGITLRKDLKKHFNYLFEKYGKVYVETDMRAMYNPTRMKVIKSATINLIQKINCLCPACNAPGFSVTKAMPGLPCSDCGMPTRSTLTHIYECKLCKHKIEKHYPNGLFKEEPTFCDFCNP